MTESVTVADAATLPQGLRVTVVHDYLTQRGGAERVVLAMLQAFPQARLLTSVYNPEGTFPAFAEYEVQTMRHLQKVAAFRADPRRALPLLPHSFRRTVVEGADVVVCSSSGWAHGVTTSAPKLVYCYNPARWIYQESDYVVAQPLPVRALFKVFRPYLRAWDQRAAASAARYLTTSSTVRQRIADSYGIAAELLPPPVSIDVLGIREPVGGLEPGFFLVVGRARGYKNVVTTCEAFAAMPHHRLVIVGGLPDRPGGGTWPANLIGLVAVPDSQLRWLYHSCRAVLATAHEDFGLTPLEGNAFGRPALVLRAGGFLDTLRDGVSGHYIEELTVDSVRATVQLLLQAELDSRAIVEHADGYSMESFVHELRREVLALLPSSAS